MASQEIPVIGPLLTKIVGSRNDRFVKRYTNRVEAIGKLEEQVRAMTDDEMAQKVTEFRERHDKGAKSEDLLIEALAVAREAMDRGVGIRNTRNPEAGFDPSKLPDDARAIYEQCRAEADAMEPIDPEGWASGGAYLGASLAETLGAFESERRASLEWLDGLASPDWNATYAHPELGELTAGDLYASWAAHDALHLAQLARVRAHVLSASAAPHGIRYATG